MSRRGQLVGAAVLAATLAVPRPCAAADADPPQRVRTAVQTLGFLGLDFALLYFSPPPAADPPGNVRLIDKLTLKAWSFDASAFATNFAAHPLAGTFYYTIARSNRSGPLESLGWASLASLTWELAEFPENVSLNDLIVTPVGGASIGESLVQLSQWLDRRPRSPARGVLAALLFPMKLFNGGPAADDGEDGALAVDLRLVSGGRLGGSGELGMRFATRLVHFPHYGEPGEGAQFGFRGNVSALSVDARANRSGLTDLRFTAGAALATVYQRWIRAEGEGWDLLAFGGVAYEMRQHAWDAGPMDAWSSVHVPGLGIQLRRMDGPFAARRAGADVLRGALVCARRRAGDPCPRGPHHHPAGMGIHDGLGTLRGAGTGSRLWAGLRRPGRDGRHALQPRPARSVARSSSDLEHRRQLVDPAGWRPFEAAVE